MGILARRLFVGQECPTDVLGADQAQYPDVRLYDSWRASSVVIGGNCVLVSDVGHNVRYTPNDADQAG